MTTSASPIECPRCGYDQRGAMDQWIDRCPLGGRCTECGLEFKWSDLMGVQSGPRWCVEHAWSVGQFYRRAGATFLRTFLPWSFWRGLQMWHGCRWGYLLNYGVLLLLVTYVAFVVSHGAVTAGVWRGAAGGWPGQTFLFSWGDVMRSMAMPWSSTSPVPGAVWSWPSSRGILVSYWTGPMSAMVMLPIMHAICPLVFIALPQSRRMARVRWRHIVRVTVYGVPLLLPVVACGFVVLALEAQPAGGASAITGAFMLLLVVAVFGWLLLELLWWSFATGRFLRMRHAWGVGAVVTVIASMATVAILFWSTA